MNKLDVNRLFEAYEECRADNTAHFRKIMELQKENDFLIKALEKIAKGKIDYPDGVSLGFSHHTMMEIANDTLRRIKNGDIG